MESQAQSLLILSFLLAIIPLFVSLGTAYLKVHIVLSTLRMGLGTQNIPGGMILMSLSLLISVFVMEPVIAKSITLLEDIGMPELRALQQPTERAKLTQLIAPWKTFMFHHTGSRELKVIASLRATEMPCAVDEPDCFNAKSVPLAVLLPAFITSELKEAFAMGFALLLPFLIIDILVANILVGLGMYMVSPVFITLPIKLLLFVSVDGWLLVTESLIRSYAGG